MKLFTTAFSIAIASLAISATAVNAAKTKDTKGKPAIEKQVKTNSFSSAFPHRNTNKPKRVTNTRGPGFELGFDGHSGGL